MTRYPILWLYIAATGHDRLLEKCNAEINTAPCDRVTEEITERGIAGRIERQLWNYDSTGVEDNPAEGKETGQDGKV